MRHHVLALAALLALGSAARPQGPLPRPPAEDKGTYLGALFAPVPEILYDHLPDLPRGGGVAVAHVLPESPAASAGLRRNDLLVRYGDEKVRDCEHLARLIHDDRAGRVVRLTFLRGGREMRADATLALGPALKIAPAVKAPAEAVPPGIAKPANPEAVTVAATPLGGNSVKVTIEYYAEGTGRLQTVSCSGTPEEIDDQVRKLPERVRDAAKVGLQRLRELNIQPRNDGPSPQP
jgi:hypothetical protein